MNQRKEGWNWILSETLRDKVRSRREKIECWRRYNGRRSIQHTVFHLRQGNHKVGFFCLGFYHNSIKLSIGMEWRLAAIIAPVRILALFAWSWRHTIGELLVVKRKHRQRWFPSTVTPHTGMSGATVYSEQELSTWTSCLCAHCWITSTSNKFKCNKKEDTLTIQLESWC